MQHTIGVVLYRVNATPRRELELVRARLRQAEMIDGKRQEEGQ